MKKLIIYSVILLTLFSVLYFFIKRQEKFTNESGYFANTKECSNYTLRDCLNTSNCVWLVKDSTTGFDSKCIPGTADAVLKKGSRDKIYANDVWTRALVSNDNNFSEDIPVFN